jgi:hypothetical protein
MLLLQDLKHTRGAGKHPVGQGSSTHQHFCYLKLAPQQVLLDGKQIKVKEQYRPSLARANTDKTQQLKLN